MKTLFEDSEFEAAAQEITVAALNNGLLQLLGCGQSAKSLGKSIADFKHGVYLGFIAVESDATA